MLDAMITYIVVLLLLAYSIMLLHYSTELIKEKIEGDLEDCTLDENILATQGMAYMLLVISVLCLVFTMHTYNPKTLDRIKSLGTKIPYTKYMLMSIILGMAIYILINTEKNKGCAKEVNLHTEFLDAVNIGVISVMGLFIIYKVYYHFKNKNK